MTPFIVTLDSNPDPMLTGLLLGLSRGEFKRNGLDVQIRINTQTGVSNQALMQAASQEVSLAVASSMALFKFHLSPLKVPLKAVAAPVQDNFYAFATIQKEQESLLHNPGLSRVGLSNHQDVDRIFNRMFGGVSDISEMVRFVPTEGLSDIEKNHVDFLFVNTAWDVFIAKEKGLDLTVHPWPEEDLRFAYTPVYVAHPAMLDLYKSQYSLFFSIADEHYCEASHNPLQIAKELHRAYKGLYPYFDNLGLLQESMQYMARSFVDEQNRWGCMKLNYWQEMVLLQKRMIKDRHFGEEELCECHLSSYSGELFSNSYLPYDM